MRMKRSLLIGWDAADWQVIDPLIEAGKMPSLAALIQRGTRGNLATLQPNLSPLLWTSIATGKRAHEHGIQAFVEYDAQQEKVIPVQADRRQVKAYWSIFSEAGLRCNIVNWWPSAPVERIKGQMVSRDYTIIPGENEDWTPTAGHLYPADLENKLATLRMHPRELTAAHLAPFFPHLKEALEGPMVAQVAGILAKCANVQNMITELMQTEDWQHSAVYFEAIDHFSHLAMAYHPPQLSAVSDRDYRLYKEVVTSAYRFHDMMLERLLELAGPDCHVFLVSDHGFESGAQRQVELPELPAAPALEHRAYGIFVAAGPEIKAGEQVYGASLLDICPTLLHLHDLPLADDMPGRCLEELFRMPQKLSHIPSWELSGQEPQFEGRSKGIAPALLKELEELGYVSLSENQARQSIEQEWQYNKALSLHDAGLYQAALPLAQELHREKPSVRSAGLLADLYLNLEELSALEALFKSWPVDLQNHPFGLFLKGLYHLQAGELEEGLSSFRKMEGLGLRSAQLYLEMARTLLVMGRYEESEHYLALCFEQRPQDPVALTLQAEIDLQAERPELALERLEQSLELRYYQPQAHYLMARLFQSLGKPEEARLAVRLALKQAPKHRKAQALLKGLKEGATEEEAMIVVSGFPRSGTSMLMGMLDAAGIPLLTDAERAADDHNPRGYFELSATLDLGRKEDPLPWQPGSAVKVVAPLLRYLSPRRHYRVILVKRPWIEVILSQAKMKADRSRAELLADFPYKEALNLEREYAALLRWLEQEPHLSHLEIEYHQALEAPETVAAQIAKFLGKELDLAAASQFVEPALYRNKIR